jgi:hypothetical protein
MGLWELRISNKLKMDFYEPGALFVPGFLQRLIRLVKKKKHNHQLSY